MSKGIHVLHRASLRLDVLTLPVRVRELGVRVRQEHSNRFRMAVHHRFLTRLVLDPNYSNSIIFELNGVMLGINFHGIVRDRLGYSCSCHHSLLSIQWDADKSSLRTPESTPCISRPMNTYNLSGSSTRSMTRRRHHEDATSYARCCLPAGGSTSTRAATAIAAEDRCRFDQLHVEDGRE